MLYFATGGLGLNYQKMRNTTPGPKKANIDRDSHDSDISTQGIIDALISFKPPRFQISQLAPTQLLQSKSNIEVMRELADIADHGCFQDQLWEIFKMAICSKQFSKLKTGTKQDLVADYRNISQIMTSSFVGMLHHKEN